ncbi:MAG TPA: ribonuclease HII [Candidatus Nanoarchaeia archaeon]|nr:ribonuclease HII [Candidatus Nanoarchaeia archaeon]
MLVAGIDEAGRGCVIGPLVVAGVLAKEETLVALASLGVKDSKLLTAKKREALVPEIVRLAEKHVVLKVSPSEIDRFVESQRRLHKLNRLEAETMAKIVTELEPDLVYVDAADVMEKRFGQHIIDASAFKTRIISEHKADRNYPIVSAASILAKVERDASVAALRSDFGNFGTGYLTDPRTTAFLESWIKNHDEYPECVRKSWKPAKQVKANRGMEQQKLF